MALELIATALIRYTYMKSPLGPTVLQVLVGGRSGVRYRCVVGTSGGGA